MSTLPGGRLAPQPPVTRVAAGGVAFLVASVFSFMWAALGTMVNLTDEGSSTALLTRVLRPVHAAALRDAVRTQPGSPVSVDADLVNFSIDRAATQDINIAEVLSRQRAAELYNEGFPADPGVNLRTDTAIPRSFLEQFSANRHKNIKTARTASLIGLATGFLLCAVIATGASRFLLPGAAALLGFVLLEYHRRLLSFWVEPGVPGGQGLRGLLRGAVYEPGRQLIFITIALLVSGLVFRALRGPIKAVMRSVDKSDGGEAPA